MHIILCCAWSVKILHRNFWAIKWPEKDLWKPPQTFRRPKDPQQKVRAIFRRPSPPPQKKKTKKNYQYMEWIHDIFTIVVGDGTLLQIQKRMQTWACSGLTMVVSHSLCPRTPRSSASLTSWWLSSLHPQALMHHSAHPREQINNVPNVQFCTYVKNILCSWSIDWIYGVLQQPFDSHLLWFVSHCMPMIN